jgi:hypothetical protein
MERMMRAIPLALVVAGAMTALGAPTAADAQRTLPRVGSAAPPSAAPRVGHAAEDPRARRQVPDPRFPQSYPNDPRFPRSAQHDPRYERPGSFDDRQQRRHPRGGGTTVVYVPVPAYGYGYSQQAYYPQGGYGVVYDVNGRPLSSSLQAEPPVEGFSYTPDLSGSAYEVTNEGMMVVNLPSGERRAFPSCAGQVATRDPDGRPRTIFYQPTDYWMVLRPGQRGRVQGNPPIGTAACYAIDTVGKVVLRY